MPNTHKLILITIISALAGVTAGGFSVLQISKNLRSSSITDQKQISNQPKAVVENASTNEWEELIKHNCELSGGSFANGKCTCDVEENLGQTQEMMYDKNTGYCQSTHGGPAGDAFNASIGLPYGEYSYWLQVVMNACTDSGGDATIAARCICPEDKTYSKINGKCE